MKEQLITTASTAEHVLRSMFPLCEVHAWIDVFEQHVWLLVRDSGGLEAKEKIPLRVLETTLYTERVAKTLARLADVFETPSHWMAL